MYWVVYSFFTIIEAFVSIILYWCVVFAWRIMRRAGRVCGQVKPVLSSVQLGGHGRPTQPCPLPFIHPPNKTKNRIPFYYAFKLAFLVYLGYPGWNGATLIYNNFLKAREWMCGDHAVRRFRRVVVPKHIRGMCGHMKVQARPPRLTMGPHRTCTPTTKTPQGLLQKYEGAVEGASRLDSAKEAQSTGETVRVARKGMPCVCGSGCPLFFSRLHP